MPCRGTKYFPKCRSALKAEKLNLATKRKLEALLVGGKVKGKREAISEETFNHMDECCEILPNPMPGNTGYITATALNKNLRDWLSRTRAFQRRFGPKKNLEDADANALFGKTYSFFLQRVGAGRPYLH